VLVCKSLEDLGFVNGFSTRLGGVSPFPKSSLNLAGFNEDSAENIYENRRRFLRCFPGSYTLALAWQVHGDSIRTVGNMQEAGDSDVRADAVVSDLCRVLAGVKTADCVPVLVADPSKGVFAAIHAGWRGTVRAIVTKVIAHMRSNYLSAAADLVAAIGPAASARRYEIGQDVIDEFERSFGNAGKKYFRATRENHALVDLHEANRDQLIAAGVPTASIHVAPFCTMERTDLFFSYRNEKIPYGKTGRLLSVIGKAI
jgi:YfiH family protein